MTNVHTSRHIDLLPGRSLPIVLANSLTLMRAGLSKQVAMQQALNAAGYRSMRRRWLESRGEWLIRRA